MHLECVVLGPAGFDVRTFECARCDHAYIVPVAIDLVSDTRSLHARAIDALEEAQAMSPGVNEPRPLKKGRAFSVELSTNRR